jgi:hypothetical protein
MVFVIAREAEIKERTDAFKKELCDRAAELEQLQQDLADHKVRVHSVLVYCATQLCAESPRVCEATL